MISKGIAILLLSGDEGVNYNYEKGKYAVIPLTYNDKDRRLTIGDRKGYTILSIIMPVLGACSSGSGN